MPEAEKEAQHGRKAGSLGRLLPGLKLESTATGVLISGLLPESDKVAEIAGVKHDEHGFLVPRSVIPSQIAPGCPPA
jgi:hypothetical protein